MVCANGLYGWFDQPLDSDTLKILRLRSGANLAHDISTSWRASRRLLYHQTWDAFKMYWTVCLVTFLVSYIAWTSCAILYHRGVTHGALKLPEPVVNFLHRYGVWISGTDLTAWVVMHRRHHEFADEKDDPHSPHNVGIFAIIGTAILSYRTTLHGLRNGDPEYLRYADDLPSPHWVAKAEFWILPVVVQLLLAYLMIVFWDALVLALCLFLPLEFFIRPLLVNGLGHYFGSRNFNTRDKSTNNHIAMWLVHGEGLQNNHHYCPMTASFAHTRNEVDPGYWFCLAMERLGLVRIVRHRI